MDKDDKQCLSPLKLFERLVALETAFGVCQKKDAEALVLARELVQRNVEAAKAILDTRLEGLNQLREEVTKDRELLLRRETFDTKVALYDRFVADASTSITRMETRYEGRITFATILSVVSVLLAFLAVIIPWVIHK